MKNIILISLFAIALASCKKTSNNTNTNACGTSQDLSKPYFPLTPGDFWKSKSYVYGSDTYRIENTVLSSPRTVHGKSYYSIETKYFTNNVEDPDNDIEEYSNYNGNVYFLHDSGDDEIVLKESAAVNDTWSDTVNISGSGSPLYHRIFKTVKEKFTSRMINGITYTQVFKIEEQSFQDMDTNGSYETLTATWDVYYAKGVGVIEADLDGDLDEQSVLECFTIH